MTVSNIPVNTNFNNGSASINQYKSFINFINIQTRLHADKPFARYLTNNEYKVITYAEADRVSTNLACKWANATRKIDVISYIGDHCVDYLLVMLAIFKLRTTMFAISPRNSQASCVSLLEKTNSKLVLVSETFQNLVKDIASTVTGVKVVVLKKFNIKALLEEPLYPTYKIKLDLNFSKEDLPKPVLILHR
jgi:long-subunit acyl-CoA synthetase (AMP-forming)